MKISTKTGKIKYAIRDILILAKEVERSGKKLYHFNIGDPDRFDFDTPQFLKDALIDAISIDKANYYTDSAGDPELRAEIARRQKRLWGTNLDPEKILVTTGVSEAISFLSASIAPGSEILVPSPLYPSYLSYFAFHGVNSIEYKTEEKLEWQPDVDDIRNKITPKTEAILIINPNNPTGAVYSPKIVKEIANIAGEHDLLLISDEIYDLLTYGGTFKSTASLTDVPVLELNGISKTLLSPGWRIGWANLRDEEGKYDNFWDALAKQSRIRLCANSPIQKAVSKIINNDMEFLTEVNGKLSDRAKYFTKRINSIEGLSTRLPRGAFYAFPRINLQMDDKNFVVELLQATGVLFVFGSGFGELGKQHFRSVILPDLEIMEEALNHVESYVRSI
ncbi:MAG: aminotransferase class I/II-fold pyridoxal phosphate-dependent enzyme [Candidatus Hodarchaeales archaeon]|jgi:aspartate/methionine/tyrosine aminotransferase